LSGDGGVGLAEEARASFEAGDYARTADVALGGLADHPDDTSLLRLAGKARFELGHADAVDYLRRATELDADDADAWRELADALISIGRPAEAGEALGRAVQLRPDDTEALVDLGHTAYAAGQTEDAIASLRRAREHDPDNAAALRALVEIHRREGRPEDALSAARALAESRQDDALAALDVAELALDLGLLDECVAVLSRLRLIDDDPEHEVYALHALIEAELRRERWRRALDLAVDATRVDRLGRTTDVLAYMVARVFGATNRSAPDRLAVEGALAASRAEHRRIHEEALVA
jgi:superkiller protein 3